MKLKDGVIISEIDGQTLAVDAGNARERFNGMIRMNGTAGFVARLLEKETELESIVEAMTEKYDVSPEDARANALKVIETFRSAGLLT